MEAHPLRLGRLSISPINIPPEKIHRFLCHGHWYGFHSQIQQYASPVATIPNADMPTCLDAYIGGFDDFILSKELFKPFESMVRLLYVPGFSARRQVFWDIP